MAAPNAWNLLIGAPTFSQDATLTVSDEVATLPGTNMQLQDPADYYEVSHTIVDDPPYISLDAGSQKAFNGIFLGYTNLTSAATWRIRWADTLAEITSGPSFDTALIGAARRMPGGGHNMTDTDAPRYGALTDFSLECWFRVLSDRTLVGIMSRGLTNNDPAIWLDSSGKIVFGEFADTLVQITGTTVVAVNTWYHVSAGYQDSTGDVILIVNGVQEATGNFGTSWSTATVIEVAPDLSERINGDVSNCRVWSKKRTPAEVLADKDTLLVGTETSLISAWQAAEATGTTVPNAVGAGNALSPSGAPTGFSAWVFPDRAWSVADYPDFMERHCLYTVLPTGAAARFMRIDVSDPSNPDAALRFGRINVGGWIQPLRNAQYGTDLIQWFDTGSRDRTVNGASIVVPGAMKRRADFRFGTTEASDVSLLAELHAARGGSYDVVFCMDPSETDSYTHQGLFAGVLQQTSRIRPDAFGYWRSGWQVEEL